MSRVCARMLLRSVVRQQLPLHGSCLHGDCAKKTIIGPRVLPSQQAMVWPRCGHEHGPAHPSSVHCWYGSFLRLAVWEWEALPRRMGA